jgi:hypothetical protein
MSAQTPSGTSGATAEAIETVNDGKTDTVLDGIGAVFGNPTIDPDDPTGSLQENVSWGMVGAILQNGGTPESAEDIENLATMMTELIVEPMIFMDYVYDSMIYEDIFADIVAGDDIMAGSMIADNMALVSAMKTGAAYMMILEPVIAEELAAEYEIAYEGQSDPEKEQTAEQANSNLGFEPESESD